MQLNEKLKNILLDINFEQSYKLISEKNLLIDGENSFENYSNNEVLSIFKSLGYLPKFKKRENFFENKERLENYEFIFNISLKYGLVELIWALKKDNELLDLGGPWSVIIRLLNDGVRTKIKKPSFKNYKDLESILKDSLSLYEDFKSAVLEMQP